jgi:hypothetical protein
VPRHQHPAHLHPEAQQLPHASRVVAPGIEQSEPAALSRRKPREITESIGEESRQPGQADGDHKGIRNEFFDDPAEPEPHPSEQTPVLIAA